MTSTVFTGIGDLVTNDAHLEGADQSERLGRLQDAAVVVQDPADVALEKMIQVEVALVGEAPDPLARVVEIAGSSLPGAPLRIDVLPRGRGPGVRRRRGARRLSRARRKKGHGCQADR